jgi:hypothetical protein
MLNLLLCAQIVSKLSCCRCFRGPYCPNHQSWSEVGQELAGLYWDQVMGIGQSKPGERRGEMQPCLGQCKRALCGAEGMLWLGRGREKQEIPVLVGDQQENMDNQHQMWGDPVWSGSVKMSRRDWDRLWSWYSCYCLQEGFMICAWLWCPLCFLSVWMLQLKDSDDGDLYMLIFWTLYIILTFKTRRFRDWICLYPQVNKIRREVLLCWVS